MPKFFVEPNQIKEEKIHIIGQDVNHIRNVLRKQIGDKIEICDTVQNFLCEIESFEKEIVQCKILEKIEAKAESNVQITIFQGLPKAEKMELIIQKSVELGVFDITPVEMKRCVVKLTQKDKQKKIQRWQKISEVAAKQCGRDIIPKINDIIKVKNVCNLCSQYDIVLVAYENEKENKLKQELEKLHTNENIKIAIIIGPEGGLEETDVELLKQNGAKVITLGNRILRTETVALNMISIIMYELEKN